MNRYPEMKDSGVSWIGEIPKHWETIKGKRAFYTQKQKNDGYIEKNILSLTLKGVIRNKADKPIGLSPSDYSTYQIFEKNDLVFKLIDLNNISTSRVGLVPERGIMSSAYIRLTSRKPCTVRYFYLFYYHLWLRNIYNGLGAGVRQTLSADDLLKLEISVPPRAEQDQIVRFLDWKASCINRLIALRRKQVERLEELKKALVSRAVTRGLDPRAPMKDSGVSWIGEISEHWPLERGKNLYEKMQRSVRAEDEVVTCFRDGTVTLRKNRRTTGFTESLKEIGYQGIKKGDLVIHVMDAFAGSVGVSDSDGKGTPVYSVCQAKADINNYYYAFLLREMARTGYIQSLYRGIRERSSDFRFEVFAAQFYPVPPRAEQDQIVAYLDARTAKIDAAVGAKERQIEKLRELKTRLISDAVTGKIDVRGVSVPDGVYAWEDAEEPGGAEDEDLSEEADGDERS